MCGKVTPENEQVKCSHCGKVANPSSRWEHGWPLYGKITLGLDCCSLDSLWGDGWHKKGYGFDHPAMLESGFQEINFEWGNGHQFDSTGKYRLCWHCQRELMRTVGEFFKSDVVYSKEKAAPKENAENACHNTQQSTLSITAAE